MILDSAAAFFLKLGIHPVLGSFLAGVIVALLLFRRGGKREPLVKNRPGGPARQPGPMSVENVGDVGASLSVGGRPVPIAPEAYAEVQRLISGGNRIAAIKLVREATGLGLKEAKDAVEELEGKI